MINPILYLAPPAAGAIIGYVTNALAIKMLFRPLRPVRIWGITLPFTPGILPRQRHKLADNIGRMVERELLTVDILRQRLRSDGLRTALAQSISEYTERLGAKKIGDLSADHGRTIAKAVRLMLDTPAVEETLRSAAENLITKAGEKTLPELLGTDKERLRAVLADLLAAGLAASADTAAAGVAAAADAAYPRLAGGFRAFLERREVRSQLESQGRVFLRGAILKLNVFQRFFLSAAQYDRTLHDRMPEIIEDLYDQIDGILGDNSTRERLIQFIADSAARFLSTEEAARRLADIAAVWGSPILEAPLKRISELVSGFTMEDLVRRVPEFIKRAADSLSEDRIAAGLETFIRRQEALTIAELIGLRGERKDKIDAFITDRLLSAADERLPGALEALDVRNLVTERIDTLDMEDVERIVLDVLADQLRWINLFGAILGALIGVAQVGLSVYVRAF